MRETHCQYQRERGNSYLDRTKRSCTIGRETTAEWERESVSGRMRRQADGQVECIEPVAVPSRALVGDEERMVSSSACESVNIESECLCTQCVEAHMMQRW